MKYLLILLSTFTFSFASQPAFIMQKYDKEIELEAKIIFNIASTSIKDTIKLFIPKISSIERNVYSKYFSITTECKNANFIYINKNIKNEINCDTKDKIFFTNNYKKLLVNAQYYGAFFWQKSRPNIVFIKNRLKKYKIDLPKNYDKYIEDFE